MKKEVVMCIRTQKTTIQPTQTSFYQPLQRAKKVVSDRPGLVDFAIGLVNSVFNLPNAQVIFF